MIRKRREGCTKRAQQLSDRRIIWSEQHKERRVSTKSAASSSTNVWSVESHKKSTPGKKLLFLLSMVCYFLKFVFGRSEVLRIERQLEEARGKLTAIRQAKYKLRGGDTSGEDTDGYVDGPASR